MIKAIQIALSGLTAASRKAEASANNIANMSTTGALDPANGPAPYQALTTLQTTQTDNNGNGLGVRAEIVPTARPTVIAYAPDSPFANSEGMIGVPNVDLATDIVSMKMASTIYKANVKTIQTASDMQKELLSMFDERT
jgi:flagellar basal-body rod protein FlgC